jgi:pimeloyl-[acyl-carrier protein] methyl ester esterase
MAKIFIRVLGQGQPLVLVHGWAMHSGLWGEFAEQLAQHYQVICVDLPDHGRSEPLDEFTLQAVGDSLINALPDMPCYWLGWSLGASIALDIARRYPQRVQALMLLAGNPYFHAPVSDNSWRGVDSTVMDAFAEQLQYDSQTTLLKFLLLQVLGLPNAKALLPQLKQAVFAHPVPTYQTLQQGLNILKDNDLRPALANLTIPTAAILGSKDTLVPVGVGEFMQALQPNLQLHIIDRAGHIPFLSHQAELLAIIHRFIANASIT